MPSPWSVRFEPGFVLLAAVAAVLYVRAWRRAPGPAWRAWCFGGGLALVGLLGWWRQRFLNTKSSV